MHVQYVVHVKHFDETRSGCRMIYVKIILLSKYGERDFVLLH